METVQLQGYTEEIKIPFAHPAQSIRAAHKAATQLYWGIISQNGNTLEYYVPPNPSAPDELLTITVNPHSITFHSRPANEYYADYGQNTRNATLFRNAIAQIVQEEERAVRNMHPKNREPYGALLVSKTYLVTPLILYANILVFVAMVFAGLSPIQPTAKSLYEWGGNFSVSVMHGEWWRLITYMFLHGGAMHLFMNTFGLLYIGMFLEPLIGKRRFALAYILTGIFAGLLSITFHPGSVGVGASGAIFGMYGVFFAFLTTNYLQKAQRTTMRRSLLLFIVYGLLAGMEGNTDNAAHIGGLLSGILLGYGFHAYMKRNRPAPLS